MGRWQWPDRVPSQFGPSAIMLRVPAPRLPAAAAAAAAAAATLRRWLAGGGSGKQEGGGGPPGGALLCFRSAASDRGAAPPCPTHPTPPHPTLPVRLPAPCPLTAAAEGEMGAPPPPGSLDYDLNDPCHGSPSSGELYGRPDRDMAPSWGPGAPPPPPSQTLSPACSACLQRPRLALAAAAPAAASYLLPPPPALQGSPRRSCPHREAAAPSTCRAAPAPTQCTTTPPWRR
jgi:hypothetical protein